MKFKGSLGFSLVEICVVVAVVMVLTSIAYAVGKSAMKSAAAARETNAARTLITAYLTAAVENDGMLMPGYDDGASGYETDDGRSISAAAAHRYPFRLAPYFNYGLDGVILVNRNKIQLKEAGLGGDNYGISLCPALGMNTSYVGGTYESGVLEMPAECATRMAQVSKPSSMLVFASAGKKVGSVEVDGFHSIDPPSARVSIWDGSDQAQDYDPANYGNVDFRYNGKAICAFLDGSVRNLEPKQLRDMRLWNRNAQDRDDPVYTVSIEVPGPGRGPGRR